MVIAVTGHRPQKLNKEFDMRGPCSRWLFGQVESILRVNKPEKIITGMAMGFDMIAASAATFMGVPVLAAIPFVGQELKWPEEAQRTYHYILGQPGVTSHIVSAGGYEVEKMHVRNRWMVDQLDPAKDFMVAAWDGSRGGTHNCMLYAVEKKIQVYRLDPLGYLFY